MNKIPVPTMSSDGWVFESLHMADYLMSDFFLSEYSQTALYPNTITSLPYIIEANKESPERIAEKIQDGLEVYFSRYFKNVIVQASYRDDPTSGSKAIVDVFIEYVDSEGKTHSFAKGAEIIDGKFNRIVEINNYLGE